MNCHYCDAPLLDMGGFGVRMQECPNPNCSNKITFPPSQAMRRYWKESKLPTNKTPHVVGILLVCTYFIWMMVL